MFLITQFIGLYILNSDPFHIKTVVNGTTQLTENPLLSFLAPPEAQTQSDFSAYFVSIIIAFIFSIIILFLLTRFKIDFILKIWFFVVVVIALFISFYALFPKYLIFTILASLSALILGFIKIFRRNFLVHNLTELLIYPGIATIFVPLLTFWSIIVLLLIISVYDIWAVWHSGIMQKMAKYQIDKLKVFSGFFVPYISKQLRMKLNRMKKSKIKNKKVRVNLAILGGGDVVFPLITAGVIMKIDKIALPFGLKVFSGGFVPALFVVIGATLGLTLLFMFSEKKKFYPAMPFITAGIFVGMIISYLIF
jgi:presenilin-like A22 family membrane protease